MLEVMSSAPKINWFSTQVLKVTEAVVFEPVEVLVEAALDDVDAFELLVEVVVDDDVA